MKRLILAAALGLAAGGMTVSLAAAAPGQCSITGFEPFDCDVALDGGGLTFTLPDGQVFAFTLIEDGVGTAYLIDPDAAPGQRPDELREFRAVEGKPGCWARDEDYHFCVLVEQ